MAAWALLAGSVAAMFAGSALAADTGVSTEGRVTRYDQAYFVRFAPRSALDLVRQLPGFNFEEGDAEVRGFAGSAGNVVINGARPSAKSDTLSTLLARIPANRVARVEVGPGDQFGSDFAGRAQVANLVLSAGGGLDGSVTAQANRNFDGRIIPTIEASALLKRGQSSFSLAASTARNDIIEVGADTIVELPGGGPREFRRKTNRWRERNPYVSAAWALEQGPNRSLRINGRWSPTSFSLSQENHVVPATGAERDDRLVQDYKTGIAEMGADLTRPLAGGALKFVALANRRARTTEDLYEFRSVGGTTLLGGRRQEADIDRDERLARASWSHPGLAGFSVELSGEAAVNTLSADLKLFEVAAGGTETRVSLPIDQATVREKRAQGSLNLGRSLGAGLRLDGVLAFETSQLKVRGDSIADRSLSFWKPGLTLDWKARGGWHVQLSSVRTVAQLDFFDFISAAELSNDRINGGNSDLEPQRSWSNRIIVDRPLLGDGLIRLTAGLDRISRLQDRILTPQGFDAPGNLGAGHRRFVEAVLDTPLDRIGLKGVRAKLRGQLQRSRVLDPASGEQRAFSGFFPAWEWSADLRRDVGSWAYGATVQDRAGFTFFRTDQLDTSSNNRLFGTAFVEFRAGPATTITGSIENLFDSAGEIRRTFYSPNRRDGVATADEVRERNRHLVFGLGVKHNFGRRAATAG